MRVTIETDPLGIEDTVLRWAEADRRALLKAADLLAGARARVGEDTELGSELGVGEMILREHADDFVFSSRVVPIDPCALLGISE